MATPTWPDQMSFFFLAYWETTRSEINFFGRCQLMTEFFIQFPDGSVNNIFPSQQNTKTHNSYTCHWYKAFQTHTWSKQPCCLKGKPAFLAGNWNCWKHGGSKWKLYVYSAWIITVLVVIKSNLTTFLI